MRADAPGPLWYQLYVPGGRAVAEAAIARARAAGYSALVVTIDTPVSGMRERDIRRGAGPLLKGGVSAMLPHLWQFATHPRWVMGYLGDGAPRVSFRTSSCRASAPCRAATPACCSQRRT